MGAWGAGVFDNDAALDWLDELLSAGADGIEATLAAIPEEDQYIEAGSASQALAAAETVAAARGHAMADLPAEIRIWLEEHAATVTPDLVPLAAEAVRRVKASSELSELWEEGEGAAEWHAAVDDLLARLRDSQG